MSYEKKYEIVFFGPGVTNQEMDAEFKRLYESLITYKNNIFHLIDTVCIDREAGERLAMNIAERDTVLMQRLVAKECTKRSMMRKVLKETDQDKTQKESPEQTIQHILQTKNESLKYTSNPD